jgi:hypothetical protein
MLFDATLFVIIFLLVGMTVSEIFHAIRKVIRRK